MKMSFLLYFCQTEMLFNHFTVTPAVEPPAPPLNDGLRGIFRLLLSCKELRNEVATRPSAPCLVYPFSWRLSGLLDAI